MTVRQTQLSQSHTPHTCRTAGHTCGATYLCTVTLALASWHRDCHRHVTQIDTPGLCRTLFPTHKPRPPGLKPAVKSAELRVGEENSAASEISRSGSWVLSLSGIRSQLAFGPPPQEAILGGSLLVSRNWVQGPSRSPRGAQWSSPWTHGIALWPLVLPSCPLGQGASPSRLWPAASLPHA